MPLPAPPKKRGAGATSRTSHNSSSRTGASSSPKPEQGQQQQRSSSTGTRLPPINSSKSNNQKKEAPTSSRTASPSTAANTARPSIKQQQSVKLPDAVNKNKKTSQQQQPQKPQSQQSGSDRAQSRSGRQQATSSRSSSRKPGTSTNNRRSTSSRNQQQQSRGALSSRSRSITTADFGSASLSFSPTGTMASTRSKDHKEQQAAIRLQRWWKAVRRINFVRIVEVARRYNEELEQARLERLREAKKLLSRFFARCARRLRIRKLEERLHQRRELCDMIQRILRARKSTAVLRLREARRMAFAAIVILRRWKNSELFARVRWRKANETDITLLDEEAAIERRAVVREEGRQRHELHIALMESAEMKQWRELECGDRVEAAKISQERRVAALMEEHAINLKQAAAVGGAGGVDVVTTNKRHRSSGNPNRASEADVTGSGKLEELSSFSPLVSAASLKRGTMVARKAGGGAAGRRTSDVTNFTIGGGGGGGGASALNTSGNQKSNTTGRFVTTLFRNQAIKQKNLHLKAPLREDSESASPLSALNKQRRPRTAEVNSHLHEKFDLPSASPSTLDKLGSSQGSLGTVWHAWYTRTDFSNPFTSMQILDGPTESSAAAGPFATPSNVFTTIPSRRKSTVDLSALRSQQQSQQSQASSPLLNRGGGSPSGGARGKGVTLLGGGGGGGRGGAAAAVNHSAAQNIITTTSFFDKTHSTHVHEHAIEKLLIQENTRRTRIVEQYAALAGGLFTFFQHETERMIEAEMM